ncbi:hypothetical protein F4W67_05360 [Pseudomonas caricapapayae]|nr:hypothetical protein F4W67_05360 [Pseudomonas caricapapayae]
MFLPNLAPMCPEINTRSAEMHTRGRRPCAPACGCLSSIMETCEAHAGLSVNLAPAFERRAGHVGHRN